MKKVMLKISEGMKILAGRQLSAKTMAEVKNSPTKRVIKADSDKWKDIVYANQDGTFSRGQTSYRYTSTPDTSYGNAIMHTGFYPDVIVSSEYDSDGRLTERISALGTGAISGPSLPVTRAYNPPGSWFGRDPAKQSKLEQSTEQNGTQ